MKHVTLAYAVAVLALAGSAAAQETPQTGAPVEWAGSMLDPQVFTFVQAERLEGRTSGGEKGYLLDLQGWVGTDTSKFWGKAEAERVIGEQVEGVEVQALYSRMNQSVLRPAAWGAPGHRVRRVPDPRRHRGARARTVLVRGGGGRLHQPHRRRDSSLGNGIRAALHPAARTPAANRAGFRVPRGRGARSRCRALVGRSWPAAALRNPPRVRALHRGVVVEGGGWDSRRPAQRRATTLGDVALGRRQDVVLKTREGIVKLPTSARFSPWALSARVSVSRHT